MSHLCESLAAAHEAATSAARAVAEAHAALAELKARAEPARAAIAAAEPVAEQIAALMRAEAERGADDLAKGQASEPDPAHASALADAKKQAAEADRQAEAGRVLLARLREAAGDVRGRIAVNEKAQVAAAMVLAKAEQADASAAWNQAVEALGPLMARIEASDTALHRLDPFLHYGASRAQALRRALQTEGLRLSGGDALAWLWQDWPSRRAEIGARVDVLLASAGLPAGYSTPAAPPGPPPRLAPLNMMATGRGVAGR